MCLDDANSNEFRCRVQNCMASSSDINTQFTCIVGECGESTPDNLCLMINSCVEKPGKTDMGQCLYMSYFQGVNYQRAEPKASYKITWFIFLTITKTI